MLRKIGKFEKPLFMETRDTSIELGGAQDRYGLFKLLSAARILR
jgi:hypothetical protein